MDLRPAGETLARFPKYSLHILPGCADLGTARRRWNNSFVVVDEVECSLSLMSAILSWKLSISEKHRTVQLCTEAPKNDTLEHGKHR